MPKITKWKTTNYKQAPKVLLVRRPLTFNYPNSNPILHLWLPCYIHLIRSCLNEITWAHWINKERINWKPDQNQLDCQQVQTQSNFEQSWNDALAKWWIEHICWRVNRALKGRVTNDCKKIFGIFFLVVNFSSFKNSQVSSSLILWLPGSRQRRNNSKLSSL